MIFLITSVIIGPNEVSSQVKEKKDANTTAVWSIEKAQAWGKEQPWLRGTNFIPSNAINSLEMWQLKLSSCNARS